MMVKDAWVGTNIQQSELLEMWMRDVVAAGRSITFAVKPDDPDPDGDGVLVVNPNLDLDGSVVEHNEEPERVQISRG